MNGEEHVKDIAFLTTLAGYIHWRLTGEKVMGIGEASGMFPIDSEKLDYDENMIRKFKALTGVELRTILPKVLIAGECGGTLTAAGAAFLDPSGTLRPGIPVAPCVGDAGTGMALLVAYMLWKDEGETLEDYLDNKVFADAASVTLMAEASDIAGFSLFLSRYKKALPMERCATEVL